MSIILQPFDFCSYNFVTGWTTGNYFTSSPKGCYPYTSVKLYVSCTGNFHSAKCLQQRPEAVVVNTCRLASVDNDSACHHRLIFLPVGAASSRSLARLTFVDAQ